MTVGLVGLHGKDGHHELADGVLPNQETDVTSLQKGAITCVSTGAEGWILVSCRYKAGGCSGPRTMKIHPHSQISGLRA